MRFIKDEENLPLDNDIGMPGGSTGKSFAAALAAAYFDLSFSSSDTSRYKEGDHVKTR